MGLYSLRCIRRGIQISILLITCFFNIFSQLPYIQLNNFSREQELNTSNINSILQDYQGFIWIATNDGLYRYDGSNFRAYHNITGDDQTLPSNWVNKIFEDRNKNLWIATNKGICIYDRNKDGFIRQPGFKNIDITDISQSRSGILYFGSYDGLYVMKSLNDTLSFYLQYPDSAANYQYNRILFADDDQILVMGPFGVSTFNYTTKSFTLKIRLPGNFTGSNITSITKDYAGTYWIGTRELGLFYYSKEGSDVVKQLILKQDQFTQNASVLSLMQNKDSTLWIGTENNGLILLDLKKFYQGKTVTEHIVSDNGEGSLSNNSIYSLYQDQQNSVWIGTYSGLNQYNPIYDNFRLIRYVPDGENRLNNNIVNTFYEDGNKIWIGTEKGINIYDRKSDTYNHLTHDPDNPNSLSSNSVWAIIQDNKKNFWVGTWGGGLNKYSPVTGKFTHYSANPEDSTALSNNNIFSLCFDKKGILWIGTMGGGLDSYNPSTDKFHSYKYNNQDSSTISNNWVRQVYLDSRNRLWVSTYSALDLFDRTTGKFKHFYTSETDKRSISGIGAQVIFEDSKGHMWFGTGSRLNLFDEKTGSFRKFQVKDGLPNNVIHSILEDNNGNLWIGTDNGISEFEHATELPSHLRFINFDALNGLQGNKFNRRSALKCKDGTMFFGGKNGISEFNPSKIKRNTHPPRVILTRLLLFNKPVPEGDTKILNGKSINFTRQIVLGYRQSVFTIKFAALNYIIPQKNQYAYMLKGFDHNWIMAGHNREATFTNLDPGNYVFKVKASNNDGVWNNKPTTVAIKILPLWWQTIWFRIFSIIFIITLVTVLFLYRVKDLRKQKIKLELEVAKRIKEISQKNRLLSRQAEELNEVNILLEERQQQIEEQSEKLQFTNNELKVSNATKDKFFSIIAHDLKNPFNTIIGFLDLLNINFLKWPTEKTQSIIGHITKATTTAYELLENLLTWSRAQRGVLPFEPQEMLIKEILQKTIILLEDSASKKNISIGSVTQPQNLTLEADYNMIYTILRNLMTNALKYTPKGGKIMVSIQQENNFVIIQVKDNGVGMDPLTRENLFKINEQRSQAGTENEQGTGLGLILCKEFVNKHHGEISVESAPGKGSTFKVVLPLNPDAME